MNKIVSVGLAIGVFSCAYTGDIGVNYPKNFKEWKHIKTMLIKPEHPMGNIFHGYITYT